MGMAFDIAIIGAGFSGTMLATALRSSPASVALIDGSPQPALGAAYSTPHPEHLLNVPAIRMGAFADAPEDFYRWLHTPEGQDAAGPYHLPAPLPEDAFLPRALYGAYIQARAQHHATLFRCMAQGITRMGDGYRIALSGHDTITASRIVFATGNGFACESDDAHYYPEPWRCDFDALPASTDPIVIIGSGLTAIDTLISLLIRKVDAPILVLSRHGRFPAIHANAPLRTPPVFDPASLRGLPLSVQMQHLRAFIHTQDAQGHSWQSAIDALRPHTVLHWQGLSDTEQKRFFRHLFSHWNRVRHRMAPAVLPIIHDGRATGRYEIRRATVAQVRGRELILAGGEPITASAVFDCRGPRYSVMRHPLFSGLIGDGILVPHPTGLGFIAEEQRISAAAMPAIYALGPLLLGERLETTAVPELRQQVRALAHALNLP